MSKTKFTFNSFIALVIVFSAMAFFFTVGLADMSDTRIVNEEYRIEGTDYSIRYAELIPAGIYKGIGSSAELICEGSFGYDWGAAYENGKIFCNEYHTTTFGQFVSDVVEIDVTSGEKRVLLDDAIMVGRCASGEIVAFDGFAMSSWYPGTNPLFSVYSMTSCKLKSEDGSALVTWIDPSTGESAASMRASGVYDEGTAELYTSHTLSEVMKLREKTERK